MCELVASSSTEFTLTMPAMPSSLWSDENIHTWFEFKHDDRHRKTLIKFAQHVHNRYNYRPYLTPYVRHLSDNSLAMDDTLTVEMAEPFSDHELYGAQNGCNNMRVFIGDLECEIESCTGRKIKKD